MKILFLLTVAVLCGWDWRRFQGWPIKAMLFPAPRQGRAGLSGLETDAYSDGPFSPNHACEQTGSTLTDGSR